MSARQLRARLDRLTLSTRTAVRQDRDGAHNFTNSRRTPSQEEAKRAVDAVVPAAAIGDPTATIEAIRDALALHVGGKGELTRLFTAPADELISELERLNLATLVIAEKLIQARLFEIPPKDIATVGKAIADTLLSTTARIGKERLLLPVERAANDAKVTDHDELDPVWHSFRDEIAKHKAA
jgi:hypothetical protein